TAAKPAATPVALASAWRRAKAGAKPRAAPRAEGFARQPLARHAVDIRRRLHALAESAAAVAHHDRERSERALVVSVDVGVEVETRRGGELLGDVVGHRRSQLH